MEALSYQTGSLSRPARTQPVAGIATAELDSHGTITDSRYRLDPAIFRGRKAFALKAMFSTITATRGETRSKRYAYSRQREGCCQP